MKQKLYFSIFLFAFLSSCSKGEIYKANQIWKTLPIQHQGRIKPLDTFSREILKKVYGKETFNKLSALETILSWLSIPDFWDKTHLILIERKDLKQSLDLPVKLKRFRPSDLKRNQKLALQLVELSSLKQRKEVLDPYFKDLQKLETRLILYESVKTGHLIRIAPQKNKTTWLPLSEITGHIKKQFKNLFSIYIQMISKQVSLSMKKQGLIKKENPTHKKNLLEAFDKEMKAFQILVFQKEQKSFKIKAEIFYNHFKPFQKAWIIYLLFLLILLIFYLIKQKLFIKWFSPLLALGFGFHSLGMALRSYIMSRPPVSNMYETMIWVPWVALIAGFVFYLRGLKTPFLSSILLAWFCLFLTSLAPEILDGSLQPLEAVLRSSFWLSTHVLIITMSYSFFFLAFVLGDISLISYLTKKEKPLILIQKMYMPIYRSIQWGVILLTAGTILGGIWADYSWGRFWGWDPKESWALISLLAYLVLLHGKLIGWIKAFGMAIGSVIMFFSIIMAWYGVNFILGVGLHSYGFGSGGAEYVFFFFLLHLLLCAGALLKKHRLKNNEHSLS